MSQSQEAPALGGRGTAGAIIQSQLDPRRVYAGTVSAVHLSSDGGRSWNLPNQPTSPALVESLACTRLGDHREIVYAGGSLGLFRSDDRGESWGSTLQTVHIRALSALPAQAGKHDPQVFLAGTDADGVLRSDDGGDSWTTSNPGLLDRTVLSLSMIRDEEERVIALAGTVSGIYLSRNAGRAWRPVFIVEEGIDIESIAAVPRPNGGWTSFAASSLLGLLRSNDGGLTWSCVTSFPRSSAALIAVVESNEAEPTLAVSAAEEVFLSNNGGASWELAGAFTNPVMSLAALTGDAQSGALLAGPSDSGIVRFDPVSREWSPADSGLHATF